MKRRFELILELVFLNIENEEVKIVEKNAVRSQYNGYIASFGANIIRSGLQAAISLFENEDAKTEADRKALMKLIKIVLIKLYEKEQIDLKIKDTLIDFIRANKDNLLNEGIDIRKDIEQIATAIKLVVRTYRLEEN